MEQETKDKILQKTARILDEMDEAMSKVEQKYSALKDQSKAYSEPYMKRLEDAKAKLAVEYQQFSNASDQALDAMGDKMESYSRALSDAYRDLVSSSDDQNNPTPGWLNTPPPPFLIEYPELLDKAGSQEEEVPGEGNVAADRRYRDSAEQFAQDAESVRDAAETAKERSAAQRAEDEMAEHAGRSRARA